MLHRVAALGARPLARTSVTPNQLTTLRLATAVCAAVALGVGHPPWPRVGALIFVVSLLLDRADGTLARLKGESTPFGHRYDLVADSTANALIFAGLGAGLRHSALGVWAIPMGIVAGAAVVSILMMVMGAEARAGPRAGELEGAGGFDPDDGILAVPLMVLLGWSLPLLILSAIFAPAFALLHHVLLRRRRAGAG